MRPLWYDDPCGGHELKNETSYFFGNSMIVSIMSHKNNIGNIKSHYEFDNQGNIVLSKDLGQDKPMVRVQIANK